MPYYPLNSLIRCAPFHATKSRILSASRGSIQPNSSRRYFVRKKKKKKGKGKRQPHRVDGTNDVIVPKPAIRVRILRRVVDRIQPVESNPRGGVSISFSSRKIAWLASLPAAHERGMEKNGGKCTANEERKRDVRP